jgi:hypothetical protein
MTGLRRIFGVEKDKVTVEWRKSHEEFHDLYSSFSIIRLIKLSSDAPRRLGFASGQHVGFVVDKATLGQFFFEYFGFPCQSFHRFLHYHNHQGLTQ